MNPFSFFPFLLKKSPHVYFWNQQQVPFLRIISALFLCLVVSSLPAKAETLAPIESNSEPLVKEIKTISGKAFEAAAHTIEYPSQKLTLALGIQADCKRLPTLIDAIKKQKMPSDERSYISEIASETGLDCNYVTSPPEKSKQPRAISLRLAQYQQSVDVKKSISEELKETHEWAFNKKIIVQTWSIRRAEFATEAKFRQERLEEIATLLKKWNRFQKESKGITETMANLAFIQKEPASTPKGIEL